MFTGIIEEVGIVTGITRKHNALVLNIGAKKVLESNLGDSIAINGVCQTVTKINNREFSVDVLSSSLTKTNLGKLKVGCRVNLERALTLNKPLGGHIVQGHVQGTGKVLSNIKQQNNTFLTIELSQSLLEFMVSEGSICVNGLSLTISKIINRNIVINIIPHTLKETTMGDLKPGDIVNIEPDILIKAFLNKSEGLTTEKLHSWGY